jgi:O-antigen/teichoic acid export membrane protein
VSQSKLYHSYSSVNEKGQLLFTILTSIIVFLLFLFSAFYFLDIDDWIIRLLFENEIDYKKYRSLIMLALATSVFSFMLTNFFYTAEKIRQVRAYNIFRIVLINVTVLLALYFINGDAVVIRLEFTYGMEVVLLFIFSYSYFESFVFVFNWKILAKCLKIGLPIMASALFGIVVNFGDKYLLQKYGTLIELSNYYLAFSFASIIPLIFASVQNIWLPLFMKESDIQKNFARTKGLLIKLFLVFLLVALCVWIMFGVLLQMEVIPSKYNDVLWILPILLVTQIFTALTALLSNYLIYFERTGFVIISGLFVSIISLVLGFCIIPVWGVLGAAVTTLFANLSYLIIDYYIVLFLKKKYLTTASNAFPL